MNLIPLPNISTEDGVTIVAFRRNEHGLADVDQVRHWFANVFLNSTQPTDRMVIDLLGVPTLDSSCLGPLVQKLRQAQTAGGKLALTGVESPALEEIFALTRFDKVFPIFKHRTEALTFAKV